MAVVLGLPHCYEISVSVMSHHPRSWSRTSVVWEHLFGRHLPGVLVYVASLPAVVSSTREVRSRFIHHHCVLLPVLALQLHHAGVD